MREEGTKGRTRAASPPANVQDVSIVARNRNSNGLRILSETQILADRINSSGRRFQGDQHGCTDTNSRTSSGLPSGAFFQNATATTGRTPSDPRLMLDGILWILCTGAPWRDLPTRFGPMADGVRPLPPVAKGRGLCPDRGGVATQARQAGPDRLGPVVRGWGQRTCRPRAACACKKVTRKAAASGTLTSPRTTHWAAAEAGLGPSSTWLLTAVELHWRSK